MATDQNDRLLQQVVGLLTEIRDLLQGGPTQPTDQPDQIEQPAAPVSDAPEAASQEPPAPRKTAAAKKSTSRRGRGTKQRS